MMRVWVERVLWAATAVALAIGAHGVREAGSRGALAAAAPVVPALAMALPESDSLLDAAGVVRELDLFRPERAAMDNSEVQRMAGVAGMTGPPMPPMRPQLVLRGLVGGPALEAIVEGLPGVEGAAVLRAGETIAGITLRAVRHDTAILVAKDTTWKLTVRRF